MMRLLSCLVGIGLLIGVSIGCGDDADNIEETNEGAHPLEGEVVDQGDQGVTPRPIDGIALYSPDSRIAGDISFATLRPEEISRYTGLPYEDGMPYDDPAYLWSTWGIEDGSLAADISDDGLGSRQQVLDSLYNASFLRVHYGRLSYRRASGGCDRALRSHHLEIATLVFETQSGAETFFQNTVRPGESAYVSTESSMPARYYSVVEEQFDCTAGSNQIVYAEITNTAWVTAGPFVVRVSETFTGEDPDSATNALDYADDQLLKLRERLPQFFGTR